MPVPIAMCQHSVGRSNPAIPRLQLGRDPSDDGFGMLDRAPIALSIIRARQYLDRARTAPRTPTTDVPHRLRFFLGAAGWAGVDSHSKVT
jgi:hypothetical protein